MPRAESEDAPEQPSPHRDEDEEGEGSEERPARRDEEQDGRGGSREEPETERPEPATGGGGGGGGGGGEPPHDHPGTGGDDGEGDDPNDGSSDENNTNTQGSSSSSDPNHSTPEPEDSTSPREDSPPEYNDGPPQDIPEESFIEGSALIRDTVGHISDDIVVQGSRAGGTARPDSDIDIAIRVDANSFQGLIAESFRTPNPGSAKERTMLHAIETGKIQAGEAGLRPLRRQLEEIFGMDVDISIVMQQGPFDRPPFIEVP